MDQQSMTTAQAIAGAVVAVAFIALVGVIFWRATAPGADFGMIWSSTSAIVGVVIGAIPSFFFRSQAKAERARSAKLGDRNTALGRGRVGRRRQDRHADRASRVRPAAGEGRQLKRRACSRP